MVQTGIYMGYKLKSYYFPGGAHCVYETWDPRYPGFTIQWNKTYWYPSGTIYETMLDGLSLHGTDNYFWLMGDCSINYNPSNGYNWWISGSEDSLTDISPCNDDFVVYCKTTDKVTYQHWYSGSGYLPAHPLNITSLLQSGNNKIYIFHYSGDSLGGGWTGPLTCDQIGDIYVISYPV